MTETAIAGRRSHASRFATPPGSRPCKPSSLSAWTDGFIAAGETYDPNSRKASSVLTAVFKSGDTAIAQFGYSPALLETPGCDVEVILVLSPADNVKVFELLSEALPSG